MTRSSAGPTKCAVGRIQRLCCLGLGSEMLMPDLVRAVTALVPSNNGWFRWVGPDLQMTNGYIQHETPARALFLKDFYDKPAMIAISGTFREQLCFPKPRAVLNFSTDLLRVDHKTLQRTDFYYMIMVPAQHYELLMMRVRDAGRPVGALYVSRAPGEAPFTQAERKLLESIAGFIAHAMTPATLADDAFADSDDRALVVVDGDGNLRHAVTPAQQLLMMALGRRISPANNGASLREPAPEIGQLCRSLAATARGADRPATAVAAAANSVWRVCAARLLARADRRRRADARHRHHHRAPGAARAGDAAAYRGPQIVRA